MHITNNILISAAQTQTLTIGPPGPIGPMPGGGPIPGPGGPFQLSYGGRPKPLGGGPLMPGGGPLIPGGPRKPGPWGPRNRGGPPRNGGPLLTEAK